MVPLEAGTQPRLRLQCPAMVAAMPHDEMRHCPSDSSMSRVALMSDSRTTLAELRKLVNDFVDRRDWHQFHSPKNLSMSLAIESAELMEHFQWLSAEQSRDVAQQPQRLAAVGEELADVFCYALAMANELGLDVSTTIRQKMARNDEKYPAEKYRGRFGPEDPGSGGERGKAQGRDSG